MDSLYSDIDSLAIYGGIHPIYFDKYNRALSKRFPFAIYYRIESNTVFVYVILDCLSEPGVVKKKKQIARQTIAAVFLPNSFTKWLDSSHHALLMITESEAPAQVELKHSKMLLRARQGIDAAAFT